MCSDNKKTTVGYQKVILQRQIIEIVDSYNFFCFYISISFWFFNQYALEAVVSNDKCNVIIVTLVTNARDITIITSKTGSMHRTIL